MTRAEATEVLIIAASAMTSWLAWPELPKSLPVWEIVFGFSILSLAQSLVRDVAILIRLRRSQPSPQRKEMQCFCLESTIGAGGVLAGAILVGIGSTHQFAMNRWIFFLLVTATLVMGFLIKDFVISWNPVGLRREKDHVNVLVRWKSKFQK